MEQTAQKLRWGYSTGACAAALAKAAWLQRASPDKPLRAVDVLFPDGLRRTLPLLECGERLAIRKDGGDDPDCTHGAILHGRLSASQADARPEDYTLAVGNATVILRGGDGVGLCTRPGLDCERGKWAINTGPRRMVAENLADAGLNAGRWLFELDVQDGEELAKHTLNPHLGIVGGLSILGTSGLVRPFSHEAYIETVRICVRSHHSAGGTVMVFCTGGRTRSGVARRFPELPETAFVCIGDFIAESLAVACSFGMREIVVACMAGKLCKYAAGFANTHAHKVRQDMTLLQKEARHSLPEAAALHEALKHSVSVREALLLIPEADRPALLHRLTRTALAQFAGRCGNAVTLRLVIFDFDGTFLFEEQKKATETRTAPPAVQAECSAVEHAERIGPTYFLDSSKD